MSALPLALVEEVRKRYGFEIRAAVALSGGYDLWADSWRLDSDRGALVLRADRGLSVETAAWLAVIERHAQEAGVPCCPPVTAGDGAVGFGAGDATVTVRRWAEGIELDRDDPAQVRAAGATLARVHRVRAGVLRQRPAPSPWHAELWPGGDDPPALRDPELDAWHRGFAGRAGAGFARGVVHGDFWAGNVIWAAGRVAAVIDWSEARLDVLARELAWATWEFGHDGHYALDVDRACAFLSGYRDTMGSWEPGVAGVLIPLMRVELRRNARYSLGDPNDREYNTGLQHAFAQLRHQPAAALLDP